MSASVDGLHYSSSAARNRLNRQHYKTVLSQAHYITILPVDVKNKLQNLPFLF